MTLTETLDSQTIQTNHIVEGQDLAAARARMRGYIQLVATGPELSKSLDEQQAEDAMTLILDGLIDPVQTGIFLIALRMKRETDDENLGVLNALDKRLNKATAKADQVLTLTDPFNGYVRGAPMTAFLPPVLAACGLPTYSHGLQTVGPKYGITSQRILQMAGKDVAANVDQAAQRLSSDEVGWAYLDQKQIIPQLHDLAGLRDIMVKRTCLTTLEVVLKPISGQHQSHLMTGFVHKAYPPVYAQLAKRAGFDSAMIVRGVEGGCIPSLSQVSRYFGYHQFGGLQLNKLSPQSLGIKCDHRMVPLHEEHERVLANASYDNPALIDPVIETVLESGLNALSNQPGAALDSLVYGAAIALTHTAIGTTIEQSADLARQAIASGEALARFNQG